MPSKAEIRVDFIPPECLAEAWPLVEPWIAKGARTANETTSDILGDIRAGRAQLWMIGDAGDICVSGALVTAIRPLDEGHYVGMYALSGKQVWRWAHLLHATIYEFAMKNGCNAVRFYGRRAWARFFPDCKIIGDRNGHALFERAIP